MINRSHQPTGRLPSCDSAVVGPEGSHPTSAAADRKSWPSFSQPSTHQSLLESRDTGFFKQKQPSTKKFQHPPEAPRPPVSMLLTIASQWPEQELGFFFEGSAKHCCHTTLKLGDQGCLTLLARLQVGWLFFLKNPVSRNNTHKITWTSCVPISQQSLRFGQSDKMPTSAGDWWTKWPKAAQ